MNKICLKLILLSTFVLIFSCGNSNNDNSSDSGGKPTARERLENEGWEYVAWVQGFLDRKASLGGPWPDDAYYIFCKDERYIAIDGDYISLPCEPARLPINKGDYYIQGEYFNARISNYGRLIYCNIN